MLTFYTESVQHISCTFFYISDFVDVYLNHVVNPIPINQTHLIEERTVRMMVMVVVMIMVVTIKNKQINLVSA